MVRKVFDSLSSIGHACSEFGNYFLSAQRGCDECGGNPTLEDAQKDYREMIRTSHSTVIG